VAKVERAIRSQPVVLENDPLNHECEMRCFDLAWTSGLPSNSNLTSRYGLPEFSVLVADVFNAD